MSRRLITAAFLTSFAALSTASAQKPAMFTLTSPDVHAGQTIPMKHVFKGMSCTGENISPALSWSNAPKGTKSFAITVYDPDAPTGSGWWHWVVYNIPANVTSLPAGAGDPNSGLMLKGAVQGNTDFGTAGYGGPCPPKGDKPHHYHFTRVRTRRRASRHSRRRDGGERRLQSALPHARQSGVGRAVRAVAPAHHASGRVVHNGRRGRSSIAPRRAR